jgi:hypothetical protein
MQLQLFIPKLRPKRDLCDTLKLIILYTLYIRANIVIVYRHLNNKFIRQKQMES